MNRRTSINSPGMRRIIAVLEKHGPLQAREIAPRAALSYSTLKASSYMTELCKAKLVHISDYDQHPHGLATPIYSPGPGRNMPRPKPLDTATIRKRWLDRTLVARKGVAVVDPLMARLMGA
jgi:hypothetical protein